VRRRGHGTPGATTQLVMKDIVFIVVTLAFFGIAWVYAKSLDRL
jgi:hypothetical protein